MAQDTREPEFPELSAAALREWNQHVESIMRGVAHTLNNRATALSAVIELARDPEDDDVAATASILGTELQRVRDLAELVRSIGPPRGGMEAFSPKDAAAEALAVLTLHAEQRDHPVTIDASSAPPTRVPRWMFVRSLIALGAAAANSARAATRITVVEDGDWLVTRVESGGAKPRCEELSPYAAELSRAMGGAPLERDAQERCGFRVPTLAALRRREAR
jgi:signal transduction histidine kinase